MTTIDDRPPAVPASNRAVVMAGNAAGRSLLRGGPLAREWFATVTMAEFAGFTVPAAVGALSAGATAQVSVPTLLVAGAIEGSVLGLGQASVLRRALPELSGRRWIAATALGAVLAYAIGLTPSTFAAGLRGWPVWAVVAAGVPAGLVLLLSIGTAQWLVLRRHVHRAGRWIVATALAWLVGLGVLLGFSMPLWQPGQPVPLIILIGAGGGLLMAATTSAVTGMALRRLLD